MKWKSAFALLAMFCSATLAADDFLKFRAPPNGQPIEARVVNYDFQTQQVTLVDRGGNELKWSVAELLDSDKRLIVKSLERQLFQKKARKNEAEGARDSNLAPNVGAAGNLARRGNLKWLGDFDAAAELARATDSSEDDRPILWFRVLGDLRGLM